MTALAFEGVSRDFVTPHGSTYRAVDNLSFAIPSGTFTALVGPSGCGKSTVLNLAAGLLTPTSGQVRVDGIPITVLNRHATYMFQQDALLPWKSVRDNVSLGLTLAGQPRADAAARADEWLARVGLSSFALHYPSQLSGGMRKRVAMAQNWILDRSQLLMDEPFSALDVHTRQLMETELLSLWESAPVSQRGDGRASRRTVLFVTHDLEEAIALADDVIALSAGPASHLIAHHPIDLPRPRDLLELRTAPAFIDLYRSIWAVLRDEVARSQRPESTRA
jgi:NitT/TauT family transport system ATP-binding protein